MSRSRGSAIIAALLIVALVAVIGGRVLVHQEMWISQITARNDLDTARETALAGLHWARAVLYDDGRRSTTDHTGEAWAQAMPPTVIGEATVTGQIEDAQGRFDLNSLVINGKINPKALSIYSRLLGNLGLPPSLAESAADWIDEDDELISQESAESAYYSALANRYSPSNRPFGSIEELLRVRGYTVLIVQQLKPYITTLPTPAPINVNTASPELLSALIPRLSLADARQVATNRQREPFVTTTDIGERLQYASGENISLLSVQSRFFLVQGTVRQAHVHYQLTALLQRQESLWPRVVWLRQE